MEQVEKEDIDEFAELAATDLPAFLRRLSRIIEERMRDYDSSLAKQFSISNEAL